MSTHGAHAGHGNMNHGDHGSHGGGTEEGMPYLGDAVVKIIQGMNDQEENEVLEMLHVPVLHGGTREILLFPKCSTDGLGSFLLACFILILITVILELLRYVSLRLERKILNPSKDDCGDQVCRCKHCTISSGLLTLSDSKKYNAVHDVNPIPKVKDNTMIINADPDVKPNTSISVFLWICSYLLTAVIYMISTLLMLISMTMNIYIITSLAIGAAFGKLIVMYIKLKKSN